MPTLSTPNRLVTEYFNCLKRLAARNKSITNKAEAKQEAALCVFMAVTVVETFLNCYVRILIEEEPYKIYKDSILEQLNSKFPLDKKIKEWPRLLFGKQVNLGDKPGQKFYELKKLRDSLMHFVSNHEDLPLDETATIKGLANTSCYDDLNSDYAVECVSVVRDFIAEFFRVRGIAEKDIPHILHSWLGEIPNIVR